MGNNIEVAHFDVHSQVFYFADGDQIFTGQIMQCVVKDIDKARAVVHVDSDSDLVSKFIVCFKLKLSPHLVICILRLPSDFLFKFIISCNNQFFL